MPTKEEPDSARSWVIVAGGFVINFLLSGVSRSTALFYVALIETYGISRMKANMPFTLRSIVRNIIGPLVGAIGQHYGTREVTIAGGLFAFVGVAACSFASDIVWISLLWGGIHGTGIALGNTLYQITVNQYFEKYRATASGVAFSGACAGSFVFPVFFEYLLANMGLPGTFLIAGGLMLHVVPAGMLMKEPSWIKKKPKTTLEKNWDCGTLEENRSEKSRITKDNSVKKEEIYAIAYRKIPSTHNIFSKHQMEILENEKYAKKGIYNHGFEDKFVAKNIVEERKNVESSHSTEKKFSIHLDIFHMICDPMFHIISLSLAALIVIFDIGVTIIIDYLKDKGISESDGKYFIIMISMGDVVGKLGFGWVTDNHYLSPYKYMMLLQIIQGTFGIMPFFHSFHSLIILVVVFSIASGASIVMYPILVARYLPSVQSLALGSTCFTGGIIAFGIPPMIGYFRDTVGSYDSLYFVIGAFSVMTGLLWSFEPLFVKMKSKVGSKNEDESTEMSPNDKKI